MIRGISRIPGIEFRLWEVDIVKEEIPNQQSYYASSSDV